MSKAIACNVNCLTCVGMSTYCTSCKTATYLDSATKTCKNCPTNCAICTSNLACNVCSSGYCKDTGGCILRNNILCATC